MKDPHYKVVFLVPRYHPNMVGWIRGLTDSSVEVHVLVLRTSPLEDQRFGHVSVMPPRKFPILSARRGTSFRKFDLPRVYWAFKYLRVLGPSAVVVRTDPGLFGPAMALASLLAGTKPFFYSQKPSRVRKLPMWESYFFNFIQRFIAAGWITPVVRYLEHDEKDELLNVPGKIFIPFGVAVAESSRTVEGPVVPKRLQIVTVGKFEERKHLIEVIDAVDTVASELITYVNLTVIGQCTTTAQQAYERRMSDRTLNTSQYVMCEVKTNMDHESVLREMSQANLVIMNSTAEPASVSNVEALALGTPVIITRENGTAHYVQDCNAGRVIGIEESALINALREVLTGDVLEDWTSNAIRASVKFSPCTTSAQLMTLFEPEIKK